MELPDEVVNNIIKFMSHPSADLIKNEIIKRILLHLHTLSEDKIYKLYNRAKFSWETEVLEAKIDRIENARFENERFESDDEAERFEDEE